jgi:hypothetical protein
MWSIPPARTISSRLRDGVVLWWGSDATRSSMMSCKDRWLLDQALPKAASSRAASSVAAFDRA